MLCSFAPCSSLLAPCSLLLAPRSLLLAPCSLLLAPRSLLLAPRSLLLAPCSSLLAPRYIPLQSPSYRCSQLPLLSLRLLPATAASSCRCSRCVCSQLPLLPAAAALATCSDDPAVASLSLLSEGGSARHSLLLVVRLGALAHALAAELTAAVGEVVALPSLFARAARPPRRLSFVGGLADVIHPLRSAGRVVACSLDV